MKINVEFIQYDKCFSKFYEFPAMPPVGTYICFADNESSGRLVDAGTVDSYTFYQEDDGTFTIFMNLNVVGNVFDHDDLPDGWTSGNA